MKTVHFALPVLLCCACATAPKPAPEVPAAPPAPVAAPAPAPKPAAPPGIADRSLGLSKTSPFDVVEPARWGFVKESPGGNDRLPRAFHDWPPRIPHDVGDYLPITAAKNGCLKCHDVAKAATPEDPTPIPASHRVDLRNAPTKQGKQVAGARWVCIACHVPQALSEPPVGNGY